MKQKTIGARLKEARLAAGLSTVETGYRLRDVLKPGQWVSYATIHRIEKAPDEGKLDPITVDALCRIYGVHIEDIWPAGKAWIDEYFGASDGRKRRSRWIDISAGQRSA